MKKSNNNIIHDNKNDENYEFNKLLLFSDWKAF